MRELLAAHYAALTHAEIGEGATEIYDTYDEICFAVDKMEKETPEERVARTMLMNTEFQEMKRERDELKETNLNNVLCKDNEIQGLKRRLDGAHHKGCHCAGLPHQEGALVDPRCLARRKGE